MSSRPSEAGRPRGEGGRPPAASSGSVPPINPTRIDNPGTTTPPGPASSAAAGSSGPSGRSFAGTPTAADYYAANRGGGLFSEAISQRIGARIAVGAHKRRLSPTVLSILNLGLGCLVSFIVIATAGPVAEGDLWAAPIGLLALVGWQLAYAFDCSDGQLARVTGQSSTAGGRLDVLCDVAVQCSLVAALAATAKAQEPETPAWLLAAFAGTWMVNLVTSVMQTGTQAASMVTSTSLPVRAVKLVRDYGAVIAVAGVLLFVGLFTLINGGFLAASIAFAGRASLRSP
jgi:phosphatidylglycerophosphate synthase